MYHAEPSVNRSDFFPFQSTGQKELPVNPSAWFRPSKATTVLLSSVVFDIAVSLCLDLFILDLH